MSGINLAGPPSAQSAPTVIPGAKSPSDTLVSLAVDGDGNLLVNVAAGGGAGGTSSTFNDAFPGTGTAAGAISPGGDMVPLEVDADGNLLVSGSLAVTPAQSNTASTPSLNTISTTAEVALAANANRVKYILQNVGTTILYIAFGAVPTATSYHVALPACGAEHDGSSLPFVDTIWIGEIQVISSGVGGLLQVTEEE